MLDFEFQLIGCILVLKCNSRDDGEEKRYRKVEAKVVDGSLVGTRCVFLQFKWAVQFDSQFSGLITFMSGVISIEGNLGAGKSTLLSLFNLSVIKEPVDQWQHMSGGNILKNYYEDPKRWALTFQLNALHSRSLLWNQAIIEQPKQVLFSERSPLADRHVFGEIMYRQGNLDEAEYEIYSSICAKLVKDCPLKAIIYLRCSPELCLQRIKQRNREGEEGIPVDYLRKVHQRHEQWLKTLKSIPILTIDTGIYDINNSKHQAEIRSLIQRFIEDLYGQQNCGANKENFVLQFPSQKKVKVVT